MITFDGDGASSFFEKKMIYFQIVSLLQVTITNLQYKFTGI